MISKIFFLLSFLVHIERTLGKDPSNFKNDQLKLNSTLTRNAGSLINNELNSFNSRSIKIEKLVNENNEMRFASFTTTNKLRNGSFKNRTGDVFLDDINEKNKFKESRAKPLLNSMIDTLNVINSFNKSNQFNSSAGACEISKCAQNCELQDQQNNGRFHSGFCNSQAINLCQCCTLKHQSCIVAQRKCKSMGLKSLCNKNNECLGQCTCTINSCLEYCLSKQQKLIRSNMTARSVVDGATEDKKAFSDLFYTNSISATAVCVGGQCICNENASSETEDKPDHEINADQKLNPIYEKMLLNNRRAKVYDSLQINFSNMLRMLRLMINSLISPTTYGLNFDTSETLKTISPSGDTIDKEVNSKFFQLENSKAINEKFKKEVLLLALNRTIEEKDSFLTVFENRFEVFRNQRNLVLSKLDQLVDFEKKANRRFASNYINDIRLLLSSNLHLNHEKIEILSQTSIDDLDAVFHLTLGIKNALQLVSINLT